MRLVSQSSAYIPCRRIPAQVVGRLAGHIFERHVGVFVKLAEDLDDLDVSSHRRQMQRALSLPVDRGQREVGATRHQHLDAVDVTADGRPVKRRVADGVGDVDGDPGMEQGNDDRETVGRRGAAIESGPTCLPDTPRAVAGCRACTRRARGTGTRRRGPDETS